MEQNFQEQGAIRPWLLIVLVITILGAAGYFGWQYWSQKNTTPTVSPTITPSASATVSKSITPTPTTSVSTISTADWKTFSESGYYFSFEYPSNWQIVSKESKPYGDYMRKTVNFITDTEVTVSIIDPIVETGYEAWLTANEKTIIAQDGLSFNRVLLNPKEPKDPLIGYRYLAVYNLKDNFGKSVQLTANSKTAFSQDMVNKLDQILTTFHFTE